MKKGILFFIALIALFAITEPVFAQSFADAEKEQDKDRQEKQRRRDAERQNREALIDGGWDEAALHLYAYGMFGDDGGGGGLSFDWQIFRNVAWTFMDANYYAESFNVSTLGTLTWRPYSFLVTASVGPGMTMTMVKNEKPENQGGSYSEEMVTEFILVFGVSIGYHIGPGAIYAGIKYNDIHGVAFNIGYRLGD